MNQSPGEPPGEPPAKKMKVSTVSVRNKLLADIEIAENRVEKVEDDLKKASSKERLELLQQKTLLLRSLESLRTKLEDLEAGVWIRHNDENVQYEQFPYNLDMRTLLKNKYNGQAICMINSVLLSNDQLLSQACELETSEDLPLRIYTTITVEYNICYKDGSKELNEVPLSATSTVKQLLTEIGQSLSFSCVSKDLLLEHQSSVIMGHIKDPNSQLLHLYLLDGSPFSISCRELSINEKINTMKSLVHPPSKYGKMIMDIASRSAAKFQNIPIYCHRDNMHGNHVSLYWSGFHQFSIWCDTIDLTKEDCSFTLLLCSAMAEYYINEAARQKKCNDLLSNYFGLQLKPTVLQSTNRTAVTCDGMIEDALYAEYKGEVGSGNCDSFQEVIAYYVVGLPEHGNGSDNLSCQPRFLVEVVGSNIIVSGAAFGEHVYVDRLTPPLWLVCQPMDEKEMLRTARTLKALRQACYDLIVFNGQTPPPQPRFPSFNKFDDQQLTYVKQVYPHIFKCTITPGNIPCIVKFSLNYCEKAHRVLAKSGHAPALLHIEAIGIFKVIVMEEILDAVNVGEYLEKHEDERGDILKKCNTALNVLHESNHCHGDFRPPNILISSAAEVFVIDFEWAGKEGEAKYPMFMNHSNIKWPTDANDGMLIKYEHDKFWLNQL